MAQQVRVIEFDEEHTFKARTISVSDLADVIVLLRASSVLAGIEVRRLFSDGSLGPQIDTSDAAPGALRRLRVIGHDEFGTHLAHIDLGRDGQAHAVRSHAAIPHAAGGLLTDEQVQQLNGVIRAAAVMIEERGYRRPGPGVWWLLALIGVVLAAVGVLVWTALLLVQLHVGTRVLLQAEAIAALLVAVLTIPLVRRCQQRRRAAERRPGRVWVSTRTRSAARILRENVVLAVVVAVATAAVTTLVTN